MDFAIDVQGASKSFGTLKANDDISLRVKYGEIFGIIGPNGAGKSTLVNLIAGMLKADSGHIRTLGLDPIAHEHELRERLGVQFQEASLPGNMTVKEALTLYSSFYRDSAPFMELVSEWGLESKLGSRFGQLSGGQKQRLFICLALLNRPDLVILDELTTGLDPNARRASWELVKGIRDRGCTVLLVTHFMDEAEVLCDRIALINDGHVAALGTIDELTGRRSSGRIVSFTCSPDYDTRPLLRLGNVERDGEHVRITGGDYLMAAVAAALKADGIDPIDLRTEYRTIDDLFVRMTGGPKA